MNNLTYQCELCDAKPFNRPQGLGIHKRTVHGILGMHPSTIKERERNAAKKKSAVVVRVNNSHISGTIPASKTRERVSLEFRVMPFIVVEGNGHVWLIPTDQAEMIR